MEEAVICLCDITEVIYKCLIIFDKNQIKRWKQQEQNKVHQYKYNKPTTNNAIKKLE